MVRVTRLRQFWICYETRPNWARKVRELILFNVLCTVYCGKGCLSLESEGKGKEMRGCVSLESGIFVADNGQRTDIRGVLRGPRGPKKDPNQTYCAINEVQG